MHTERHVVDVLTDGDGAFTGYTPAVNGRVLAIHYVKDGTTGFTNGVDFTITQEDTGETIWTESDVNASKSCFPRGATHSNAGVAAVYASGGSPVLDHIAVSGRIKIVIASGGAAKLGKFHVVIG